VTGADPTATFVFEGLVTWMNTALFATLPDPAVTFPDTVNVPAPVTELGETMTVTESDAATVVNGTSKSSERSSET
jgi:hypothetical protein